MSYNPNDAVLLKHLLDLATRIQLQGYQNSTQVQALIDTAIATVYKPGGTKTAAELTSALLVEANEGKVYDISTVLNITAANKDLFVEGLEASYPVGTNFVVINVAASGETASYKFDALPGFIDLSNYLQKIASPTANNLVAMDAFGEMVDSDIAKADVVTKIASPTADNLVAQDANGKIADAGIAKGDVVTKIASPTADNLVKQDANGKIADAGIAVGNVMQKVASATENNFAKFSANGEVVDAGFGVASDAGVDEALDTVFPTT